MDMMVGNPVAWLWYEEKLFTHGWK